MHQAENNETVQREEECQLVKFKKYIYLQHYISLFPTDTEHYFYLESN